MNSGVDSKIIYRGEMKNGKRENRWDIFYEEKQIGGGSYDEEGDKNGKWIDISDLFSVNSQVIYDGEYKNGKKIGRWDILYRMNAFQQFKQIGGGSYDEAGDKNEKWIDISDLFLVIKQVTYNGEYKNGKKIGRWDIWFKDFGNAKQNNKVGGGSYDEEGKGTKVGKWIDFDDKFENKILIQYIGTYENGQKVGSWNIVWYEKFQIGGGSYDEEGKGTKVGKWIDFDDKFENKKQILYIGTYENGQRVGSWKIFWCGGQQMYQVLQILQTFYSGGGSYDEKGLGIKVGSWIDLDDGFDQSKQVTYNGEYQNGKKIGRWNINWSKGQQIGGGVYDEGGDEIKIGLWIEIDDKFSLQQQLTYIGEYKNGKKVGFWDIYFKEYGNDKQNNKIGGGSFDDEGNGIKVGKWIDLNLKFDQWHQITYKGQYLNGQKIGLWKTCRRENNILKLQCCVNYNQNGKEIFRSREDSNFIHMGEFNNGKKVGTWKILFKENDTYNQIGGGSYDQEGQELKIGEWIDVDYYLNWRPKTYKGEYKNGKKVGLWKTFKKQYKKMILQGCVNYDLNGQEIFRSEGDSNFIDMGEFNNGKKVGTWKILFKENDTYNQIGGGSYDQEGQELKIGEWIDVDYYLNWRPKTYKGEYKNGKKVGLWKTFKKQYKKMILQGCVNYDLNGQEIFRSEGDSNFIDMGEFNNGKKVGTWKILFKENDTYNQIGGGSYDQEGQELKIGEWIDVDYYLNWRPKTYKGEYKNGKKVGLWKTFKKQYKKMILQGCVNYDLNGQEIFRSEGDSNFIDMGEFNNGKKVGTWKILFKENDTYNQIGGGSYDQEGQELKIGEWIDVDYYLNWRPKTYKGEYKNGKKVGLWKTFKKQYKKMILQGCVNYDLNGQEIFRSEGDSNFIDMGEFNNGKKVGTWKILFKENDTYNQIGGGSYDQEGQELKIGEWIDVDYYLNWRPKTYKGEYKNGKKVGLWKTFKKQYKKMILQGCVNYDLNGQEIFRSEGDSNFIDMGEFNNGKKVGTWKILFKENDTYNQIGGGSYDQEGQELKIGEWIDVDYYLNWRPKTYKGEYKNGKKVGLWKTFKKQYKKMILQGCVNYDLNGQEIFRSEGDSNFIDMGEFNNGKKVGTWKILFKENDTYNQIRENNILKLQCCVNYNQNGKEIFRSREDSNFIHMGEFNNGKKVGTWKILFKENDTYNQIGGGSYDQEGQELKIGEWIDVDYYLNWRPKTYKGEYKNGKKVGLWKTFKKQYKKMILQGCVNYDLNGQEIFRSEGDSNFIDMGEFNNGKKVGTWKILFKEYGTYNQIGGGSYDQEGQELKIGEWIVLGDRFEKEKQVTFVGEYNYGKKVGRWDIWFKQYRYGSDGKNNKIGGGSYDNAGNEVKIGMWKELDDKFGFQKEISYIGEYKNGKKVGGWEITLLDEVIGGGEYDEDGNNNKIGQWIEICDYFQFHCQVTYNGEYDNCKKIGRWNIMFKENEKDKQNNKIGGGSYDNGGNGIKIGLWIEIDDKFSLQRQLTYIGEYQNGKKVGFWDMYFKEYGNDKQNNKIGGGSYDDEGNGIKGGEWIDIAFHFDQSHQITYKGQYLNGQKIGLWKTCRRENNILKLQCCVNYNQNGKEIFRSREDSNFIHMGEFNNGKKVGTWKILFKENDTYNQIGGGSYDQEGQELKIGEWIDVDYYLNWRPKTYKGEYKNGKKVGLWKTFKKQYKKMILQGCVNYDLNGQEIFRSEGDSNFIDMGEFNNGKKVGTWKILFKEYGTYNQIGGGSYDQEGQELKIGEWIVLGDRYEIEKQVTFVGEYNYGKKVGRWDIWFKQYRYGSDGKNNKIGGGSYDNAGNEVKIGMWKELDDKFGFQKEISYIGEYKNGKKVGGWEITLLDEVIGGGAYDEDGNNNKIGQWIEQDFAFNNHQLLLYKGEYKNGQKVGRWDVFFREQNEKSLKNIGYGSFDKGGNGIKIVKWYFLENEIRTRNVISYNQSWMKLAVEKQKEF
ncbi:unnamed protein product [Paramecium octaurelia]|uniref:Uncharacterized protein n=1 Tax=Paramecium octaurelia TaxID=43137 RepID=A0A8S1YJW6_PAROT|nr:unnamed protein product [Paramecium octaurelia]